jgi:threonine dehydratase
MHIRQAIQNNYTNITKIIKKTPLDRSDRLSKIYDANIYLKREDLQFTRSFKIRGVTMKLFNKHIDNSKTIVTSSSGNHAQSIAYLSNLLNIRCNIFLPLNVQQQKVNRIKKFSNLNMCTLHFIGNIFDECLEESLIFSKKHNSIYIHPFNDMDIIIGQGTIGLEIEQDKDMDYIIAPIGGGGLISGISAYMKNNSKNSPIIIGVESENNDSMKQSIINNNIVMLVNNDYFVDGSAVKQPGTETFKLCQEYVDHFFTISNNRVCYDLVNLYQEDGIVAELAGAMSISGLELIKNEIKGKNVCCVISGGNNDITRLKEIYEKMKY